MDVGGDGRATIFGARCAAVPSAIRLTCAPEMTAESDDDKNRLSRLADAIEAFLDHDPTDSDTRDQLLDAHEDLRDL